MSRDSSSSPSMPPLIPLDEIIDDDDEGEEGEVTSRPTNPPQHPHAIEEQLVFLLLRAARLFPGHPHRRRRPQAGIASHRPRTAMAIDQKPTIPYPENNSLAHPPRRFYPLKIPVSHWQLRHYISLGTSPSTLYYASSKNVYSLNTSTNRRTLIATLPFDARCTASGHGWVCIGGEHEGHFAAIQLHSDGRSPTIRIERIGEEIVNSVSIHRLQGDEGEHLDDIVAILTNNDQTVRIYSLPEGKETRMKDLPFAINHATLSPDGKMLVAVGDFNQAYFFTREIVGEAPQIPKPHNRLGARDVDWCLTNVVSLCGGEGTVGYFTTAWSPNGALVALGSEGGYITVLDREVLERRDVEDDEAIVAVVAGSRADVPSPYPGAIRSMVFSPEPWDLLCWAEDQGRVCIGDLRTGLKSRQVIHLEPDNQDGDMERLTVEDVPREGDADVDDEGYRAAVRLDELEEEFMRRHGGESDGHLSVPPPPLSSVNFAAEYIEARRRQRSIRQDLARQHEEADAIRGLLNSTLQGLTAREQEILESLRISRQREEARAETRAAITGSGTTAPRNITYASADNFSRLARNRSENGRNESVNSTAPALIPSRSNPYVGVDDWRSSSNEPDSEMLNAVQEGMPSLSRTRATASPRPHVNGALPPPSVQDSSWPRTSTRPTVPENGSSSSRLPRIRHPIRADYEIEADPPHPNPPIVDEDDENPWRTIEAHMTSPPTARGPLFEGAARARAAPPLPATSSTEEGRNRLSMTQHMLRNLATERTLASSSRPQGQSSSSRGFSSAARDESRQREAMALAATLASARETAEERDMRLARGPIGYSEALLRREGRMGGVRTAGLAISGDGGILWVACEKGIFEVRLGLRGRLSWPALEMR